MKALPYFMVGIVALAIGAIVQPIGSHANGPGATANRLVNFLSKDKIVQLTLSQGAYHVLLLDERMVQNFQSNVERLKAKVEVARKEISDDNALTQRRRIESIETGWRQLKSPWRVVMVGEDFVRLEPLVQLPGHEHVSWIALSKSSIRLVQSRK